MNKIVISPHFNRAYKKFVSKYPHQQQKIDETIVLLEMDINNAKLHTHKLSGELMGCFACSCGFDCRILFTIHKDKEDNTDIILLITIGTHDVVY